MISKTIKRMASFVTNNQWTFTALVVNLLLVTGFSLVFSVTPWFLEKVVELKKGEIGTVISTFNLTLLIGYVLAPPVIHRLGDSRRAAIVAAAAHTSCFIVMLFTDWYPILWAIDGFFYAPTVVAADQLLRGYLKNEQNQSKILGVYNAISAITTAAVIPLGEWLIAQAAITLWFTIAIALTLAVVLLIRKLPNPTIQNQVKPKIGGNIRSISRLLIFSLPYVLAIPLSLVAFNTFFLSYTEGKYSVALLMATAASGFASIFLPHLPAISLGRQYFLFTGAGVAALGVAQVLLIISSTNALTLWSAGLLIGITVGAGKLAFRDKLRTLEGGDAEKTAVSYLVGSLGGIVTPIPLGLIAEWSGETKAVWMSCLLALVFAFIGIIIQSRRKL